MKKKLLLLALCFTLFSSLAGCSSKDDQIAVVLPPVPEPEPEPAKEGTENFAIFDQQNLAFGNGKNQESVQTVSLPTDIEKVQSIKMYIQLNCPSTKCDPWDVFANVQIWEPQSQQWYEMGRYITPYGIDNSSLERGFEIDVTDFKSLLQGSVQLKIFAEVWGPSGWLVSVDLDYNYGKPDYAYSAIAPILQYNKNSIDGVPYGEAHDFILTKNVQLPRETQAAHLRTTISGWGHGTPLEDGRGCAEWCYRTHHIAIDQIASIAHEMGPIGCAANPVKNQKGNWKPDRAGWCPGMAVPTRRDVLTGNLGDKKFNYQYIFEPWVNDMQAPIDNPRAFYALSSFVVVQSDQPISAAVITP